MATKHLFVFDYDGTILDGNLFYEMCELGPLHEGPSHISSMPSRGQKSWIEDMNNLLHYYGNDLGIAPEEICEKIQSVPCIEGMEEAIKYVHSAGHDVIVVSDGYDLFIKWSLTGHNLLENVKVVVANFARPVSDSNNRLLECAALRHQTHCKLSTVNLCKGDFVQECIEQQSASGVCYDRVVFSGDGDNDYCPALRLGKKDFVFPRKDFPLDMLTKRGEVSASVHAWKDGHDWLRLAKLALPGL